jgi:hypothetical protein
MHQRQLQEALELQVGVIPPASRDYTSKAHSKA